MHTKKVNVLLPVYNGEKYLREQLDCLLNQTYNNLQVIVVDDNGRGTKEQLITQKLLQNYIYNNNKKKQL